MVKSRKVKFFYIKKKSLKKNHNRKTRKLYISACRPKKILRWSYRNGRTKVSLILSFLLGILSKTFYWVHRGWLFSFHFPYLLSIIYQLILSCIFAFCVTCLILSQRTQVYNFSVLPDSESELTTAKEPFIFWPMQ